MQLLLKILTIFVLISNMAYANFEVYPMKIQIQMDRKFATVYITNRGKPQKFSILLRDFASKEPINDLSFSPAFFNLKTNKTQTVRIALKDGIDCLDKQYLLVVNTDEKDSTSGTIGFRIPVTISDLKNNSLPENDLDEEATSTSNELTRIKISVPVIVKVR